MKGLATFEALPQAPTIALRGMDLPYCRTTN